MAFDFVEDSERNPLIIEMSYGFGVEGISKVPGFWDSSLQWHREEFKPQEWMIEDQINKLKKR